MIENYDEGKYLFSVTPPVSMDGTPFLPSLQILIFSSLYAVQITEQTYRVPHGITPLRVQPLGSEPGLRTQILTKNIRDRGRFVWPSCRMYPVLTDFHMTFYKIKFQIRRNPCRINPNSSLSQISFLNLKELMNSGQLEIPVLFDTIISEPTKMYKQDRIFKSYHGPDKVPESRDDIHVYTRFFNRARLEK